MTRRSIVLAAGVALAAGALVGFWLFRVLFVPDPAPSAALNTPRLTRLDAQRMLVVEARGDPNVVAGAAFKRLFTTYYKLHAGSMVARPPAPRARWTGSLTDTPRTEWAGHYALPIGPAAMLPAAVANDEMRVSIDTWEYGEVAEIVHVGSYSTEQPDIERLHTFITSSGYRIAGPHEEEYVRGPGMVFTGNPSKYLTVIRLRVTPLDAPCLDPDE